MLLMVWDWNGESTFPRPVLQLYTLQVYVGYAPRLDSLPGNSVPRYMDIFFMLFHLLSSHTCFALPPSSSSSSITQTWGHAAGPSRPSPLRYVRSSLSREDFSIRFQHFLPSSTRVELCTLSQVPNPTRSLRSNSAREAYGRDQGVRLLYQVYNAMLWVGVHGSCTPL